MGGRADPLPRPAPFLSDMSRPEIGFFLHFYRRMENMTRFQSFWIRTQLLPAFKIDFIHAPEIGFFRTSRTRLSSGTGEAQYPVWGPPFIR